MSTKSTIKWGEDFHFYNECFDDDNVYLELNSCYFESSPDSVMVSIPKAIWATIRNTAEIRLDYVHFTDIQIKELVTREVDDRIKKYEKNQDSQILKLFGSFIYGEVTAPRSKQINSGIKYYKDVRKKEQDTLARINKYKEHENLTLRG